MKPAKISPMELKFQEQEIEEDLDAIAAKLEIAEKNNEEETVEKLLALQRELEDNLDHLASYRKPVLSDITDSTFILMADKLINDAIEQTFIYLIWTHPDMKKTIANLKKGMDVDKDVLPFAKKFSAKKYTLAREIDIREREYHDIKTWIVYEQKDNPFSLRHCLEFRGNMKVKQFRNLIDEMAEYELNDLVKKYIAFHSASTKQEKQKISTARVHLEGVSLSDF